MDKDKNFTIPKHILDLYASVHQTKPIPSVWDFGFVYKSALETNKRKPFFEILDAEGRQLEVYFHTTEYDIYLVNNIDSFELYFLYNSEIKDSVILAASQLKKHKVKFEE